MLELGSLSAPARKQAIMVVSSERKVIIRAIVLPGPDASAAFGAGAGW
jgi:hypothetical protein